MVDASSFFIVYEFLVAYLPSVNLLFTDEYGFLIWGGFALFMGSLTLLLKESPGKTRGILFGLSFSVCFIATILFCISAFSYIHLPLESWAFSTFRLEPRAFYTFIFLFLSGALSLASALLSLSSHKEPADDSTLNTHQKLRLCAVGFLFFFVGLAFWFCLPTFFNALALCMIGVVELLTVLWWFYNPFLYLISRITHRKPSPLRTPTPKRLNRFAVIICAHNEELVIGNLIDSLRAMTYPQEKYDLFVVCDNSTDRTASIAKKRGVTVIERFEEKEGGKNNALKWIFNTLSEEVSEENAYDAYILLDADNLVNVRYLDEINTHLNQGYEIMQTYLGSKNPQDTWVSRCSSLSFWVQNELYQESRSRLNLPVQLRGTGIVLRPAVLERIPWESYSLTENINFTAQYALKENECCHWIDGARLYDEKPLNLKTSIRQRTRWMQGHISAMKKYTSKLLVSSIKNASFKQFDMALYLIAPLFGLFSLSFYLLRLVGALAFPDSVANAHILMSFESATILLLAYLFTHIYILNREHHTRCIAWIPLYYLFNYTWYLPILRGLVKWREHFWVSTAHARALKIDDIREDVLIREAKHRLAGLDNLHQLPLGQILLKAAVINGDDLQTALALQKKNGGYLGNILIERKVLTKETLDAYLTIQEVVRKSTESNKNTSAAFQKLQLGQILIDADVISEQQLNQALDSQQENGKKLGENLIESQVVPHDLLNVFVTVQDIIGSYYLDPQKAHAFIKEIVTLDTLGTKLTSLLFTTGFISLQQQKSAQGFAQENGVELTEALLQLGYITPATLETMKSIVALNQLRQVQPPHSQGDI